MTAENGRTVKTMALCLVAWIVMGLVSFVHHAVALSPSPVPTTQVCVAVDGCTR